MTRSITFPIIPGTSTRRNAETGIEITNDGRDGYRVRTFHADKGDMFEWFETLPEARREATEQVHLFRWAIEADHAEALAVHKARLSTEITADHIEAATEDARRLVKRDGADALIHFWTQMTDLSACGVDLQATSYTYGSPEWEDVTCNPCRVAYDRFAAELNAELDKWSRREAPYDDLREPISVGTLDNGAAVDAIRRAWHAGSTTVVQDVIDVTGVTTEGAWALLYAKSTASLADGC